MTNTTTVEKVRIPAEVAEAIEYFRKIGWRSPEIANVYEYIYPYGSRKFEACTHFPANNSRHIIGKYIEGDVEKQEAFIRAVVNGYEIEKPPKKITLELTPEELGTLTAALGNASTHEIVELAKEKGYIAITDPGVDMALYDRLTELALEEARA